jgi:hypothetical protein
MRVFMFDQLCPYGERMAKPRAPRSREDRSTALSHVAYEVWMCADAASRVARNVARDLTEHNAYVEVVLLHARGLLEFLTRDGTRDDDMLRSEFAAPWSPSTLGERAAMKRLEDAKPDMDKHLAHLTWRRVDETDKHSWTYLQIAQDSITLARGWAKHLAAEEGDDPRGISVLLVNEVERAQGDVNQAVVNTVVHGP